MAGDCIKNAFTRTINDNNNNNNNNNKNSHINNNNNNNSTEQDGGENMKTLIKEIFQEEFGKQAESITNLISGNLELTMQVIRY